MKRRKTREVRVRNITIGGSSPITVQSMTNVPAHDFEKTYLQAASLAAKGCDIIRVAVPDEDASGVFDFIRRRGLDLPLVADIHFDYKIALACVRAGADKIRINPGNIGSAEKTREVASACREAGIPIRIGVNSGSLEKKLLEKYGSPTPEAIAESALEQADILESFGFSDIVISIKSSDTAKMIAASSFVASQCDYPLHLGVTEAGDSYTGLVKNSVGIGSLLSSGIGDTIRVSLTASPEEEVRAGKEILRSLGLYEGGGINIISCPTCGRTKIGVIDLTSELRKRIADIDAKGKKINVALMGCVVNGPGEAREANFGIAGGDGFGVLFKNGDTVGRVEEEDIIPTLLQMIDEYICEI